MGDKTITMIGGYAHQAPTRELKASETLVRPGRVQVQNGAVLYPGAKNAPRNQRIRFSSSY
jgi:hypothetical protein